MSWLVSRLDSELHFSQCVSCGHSVTGIIQALCSLAVQADHFFPSFFVSKIMQMLYWVGQHENWPVLQIVLVRLL